MRTLLLSAVALVIAGPAVALEAVALTTAVTWEGPNGRQTIEVTPGQRLAITGPSGGGFAFEHDGTVGVLIDENLAVQASPNGCFKISLSDAYETELVHIEVRGREMSDDELLQGYSYFGPSLAMSASVSASAAAELTGDIEFCLTLEPGDLLTSPDRATQDMVLAGFTREEGPYWSLRTMVSAGFSIKAGLETTLEAYCHDEFLDAPSPESVFSPRGRSPHDLGEFLSEFERDYRSVGRCVWASRALDDDFAETFLATLAAAARSEDWIQEANGYIRRCFFAVGPATIPECEAAVRTGFGFIEAEDESGTGRSILAAWIEAERDGSLDLCPLTICDEACQARRVRLDAETIRPILAAARENPIASAGKN